MSARPSLLPPPLSGAPWGAHPASGKRCALPLPPATAKDGGSALPAASVGGDGAGRVTFGPTEMGLRGLLGAQFPCAAGGGARVCRCYRAAPVTSAPGATPVPGLPLLRGPRMLPRVPPGLSYRYCETTGRCRGRPCRWATGLTPVPRLLVLPGLLLLAAVPAESGNRERGGGKLSLEDASLPFWI